MTHQELSPADLHECRRARAGLLRIAEPGSLTVLKAVREAGPVAAWQAVIRGRVPAGLRRATEARVGKRSPAELEELAEADLARAAELGARLVIPEDQQWPEAALSSLDLIEDSGAPLGLYCKGPVELDGPLGAVTIVGSRACSAYGRRIAAEFAADLAGGGLRVVSGAAFGIDAAAHRGAIAARSAAATTAVLACGIDRPYPAAHAGLLHEIGSAGLVVSEYPPGTTPARHRFLVRNRLIAALSAVTVVVEAGRRSGTVSTANFARAMNRVTMAVPGPITSATSVGCHELLAEPDVLIAADSAQVAAAAGEPTAPWRAPEDRPTDALTGTVALVYEALPAFGAVAVDQLVQESGVRAPDVLGALAELDVLGMAAGRGGWWERVGAPA